MIFPVPVLTKLNSRRQCFLLINFPLKTECVMFRKQSIAKNHNSFQSGLSDVPSSENAWNSNFFRLYKIYVYMYVYIYYMITWSEKKCYVITWFWGSPLGASGINKSNFFVVILVLRKCQNWQNCYIVFMLRKLDEILSQEC